MSAAKRRKQEKNASPLMVKFMKHLIEQEQHFIASTSTYAHGFREHKLNIRTAIPNCDFDDTSEEGRLSTAFTMVFQKWLPWANEYSPKSILRIPKQCMLNNILCSIGQMGFAVGEADWRKNAELEDTRCKDMRKVLLQMEFKLNCDTMSVILEFAGLEHLLRGWLHAFDEVSK